MGKKILRNENLLFTERLYLQFNAEIKKVFERLSKIN